MNSNMLCHTLDCLEVYISLLYILLTFITFLCLLRKPKRARTKGKASLSQKTLYISLDE